MWNLVYMFLRMRGMQKFSHISHNRKKDIENLIKSMVLDVRLYFAQFRTKKQKVVQIHMMWTIW